MTRFTLTLLDTLGIQDYIFGSNRLQENIGASEIVFRATTLWAFEALEKAGLTAHNVKDGKELNWSLDEGKRIESDPSLQAEVVQAAGGYTIIIFRNKEQSRRFVQTLTLNLLKRAPGLMVLAQHDDEFEFGAGGLSKAIAALHDKMSKHKLSRRLSTPLLGLGVTAVCDSTGLPAVTTLKGKILVNQKHEPIGLPGERETDLISAEAAAKRGWRGYANQRLRSILKDAADGYTFPYDLEKLGRFKGEESYIAVIHADGNRMGARVREIGELYKDDRTFIQNLRAFSNKINAISQSALQTVVGLVVQAVKNEDIPVVKEKDEVYLPFRPLVFGGDDVTFVCNGLIGVSLASAYIETFEREAAKQELPDFHASAGVAIVKLHYPFARAYKLSEELTASAKTLNRDPKPDCSSLDWHFAQSGLSGSLKVIRDREYTVKAGSLTMRPVKMKDDARSWSAVQRVIKTLKKEWGEKHNKVVGLREPLRNGGNAVRKYLQDFDLLKQKLPEIPGLDVRETGWQDGTCYYFDAVELLDHYVALE